MKLRLFIGTMALIIGVACAPPTLYHWGNYENSLHKLMKDPTSLTQYGESLYEQIKIAESTGKIPPGIYAEYGYYLLTTEKNDDAIIWFEKEKSKWPESTFFMEKMIIICKNPNPNPNPNTKKDDASPSSKTDTRSTQ